jgi:predicted acylesterase/phospholipase RssA
MAETLDTPNKLVSPPQELLECDIVMAGGVTSGIIYPGAVAMIARRYLFRSIGGTSVGAIAAAATAAAEYGRRTGKNSHGFDQLAALPKSLGDTANDGHSRLFHLFTPEPFTQPLLALVTPLFGGGGLARQIARVLKVGLLAWQVSLPVLVVTLTGLTVIVSLLVEGHPFLSAISILPVASFVLLTWVAMLMVVLWRHWLPKWRANGYGICTGYASPQCGMKVPQADFEGLTPWMHRVIQSAAGRRPDEQPLTFGDLWGASPSPAPATIGIDLIAPRAIELAMIASDISRNRTVQIPFLETPSPIYIETAVLDRYFPASIVEWMKDQAGEHDKRIEPREGVIRLPKPQDIPVVFGARLSLSFPVLLSALPLMTPDFGKGKNASGYIPLRRVWFSDGGLTSNFPIHFFDSPIPSRPTFCLNLVDFDAEAPNVEADDYTNQEDAASASEREVYAKKPIAQPRAAARTAASRPQVTLSGDPEPGDPVWGFVSMAKSNRFSPAAFTAFDTAPGAGLGSFFQTLLNTARFWSDNQMLIAPGVRDRVVNIALREDEGGLNLDMSPAVIADLDQRGRAAGLLISARFDPEQPRDPETGMANEQIFANHRWVRFRNFMSSFEDLSRRFARSRRESDKAAEMRGESQLDEMMTGDAKEKLGYPAPKAAKAFYRKATDAFEQLGLDMAAQTRADENATFDRPRTFGAEQGRGRSGAAPRPKMRARLRPLVDNDPRSETADLPDQR